MMKSEKFGATGLLGHAILGLSILGLSACGDGGDAGGDAEQAEAAPDGVPGLSAENVRLVLPAVSGNPAAVYLDLTYVGDRGLSLARAHVEGAEETVMHEYGEWEGKTQMMEMLPVALTKGTEFSFKPGGAHIMAMGLSEEVKAGDTVEVTLIVSGGDKSSFPAEVRAAGDER